MLNRVRRVVVVTVGWEYAGMNGEMMRICEGGSGGES